MLNNHTVSNWHGHVSLIAYEEKVEMWWFLISG